MPAILWVLGLKRSFYYNVCNDAIFHQFSTNPPVTFKHLLQTNQAFFIQNELNENRCCLVSFFGKWGQRMPLPLNQFHQFGWTPLLAVTAEYVWVTVQTKVNRCISPRKRQREVERKTECERKRGTEKTERWRWQRDKECDSVMQAGFIVSPQRPREIISSQYGVYQSSQNSSLPSGYMPCLSASLCLSVFICCS